jgi:hypothetical protein
LTICGPDAFDGPVRQRSSSETFLPGGTSSSRQAAASIPKLVGLHDLSVTVRQAVLHEYACGRDLHNDIGADHTFYGITRPVARTLAWLIRHDPATAARTIEQITGEALQMKIPRAVSEHSIATALSLDGSFDAATLDDFLARVFTPETTP